MDLNPNHTKAYYPLGLSLISLGRFEEAAVQLNKTKTNNPKFQILHKKRKQSLGL